MKRMVMMTLLTTMTAGLLIITGTAPVYAQVEEPYVEVRIPFRFTVGDTTLPAGHYTIKRVYDWDPGVLEVESANGRVTVPFLTESAQAERTPARSDLVFDKVGNRYFLSQIWVEGDKTGDHLSVSRAEHELEAKGAKMERRSVECREVTNKMNQKG